MNLIKNKFILYSLILAFLGFVDSAYLTVLHYKDAIPPCTVTHGCEAVLTSPYSMVGLIPVALLGALFYLGVIVLTLLILTSYKKIFLKIFYLFAVVGFLVSVFLTLVQWQLLHAFCQYCLISEAVSTGILILSYLKFREDKKRT
jgi:uncharacterized membrane protein